jgi:hypothetical protein
MRRAVPLLVILVLLAAALLLLISSVLAMDTAPSPFLIAATIVSVVALLGAVFSLYTENRSHSRPQQENLYIRRR